MWSMIQLSDLLNVYVIWKKEKNDTDLIKTCNIATNCRSFQLEISYMQP